LIEAEHDFEQALTEYHVEDQETSKRIFSMNDHDAGVIGVDNMRHVYHHFWPKVHTLLKEVSRGCRSVFDYRRLREWGYSRLWNKLCLIIDSQKKESVDKENDENRVRDDGATPKMTVRDAVKAVNKLFNNSEILRHELFDVHPIDKDDLPADERCAICRGDYEDEELLIRSVSLDTISRIGCHVV